MNTASFLSLQDLVAGYGSVTVLNGLSLEVPTGARLAVLGRNGVGKSTAMKAIMGLADVSAGRIAFNGEDITHLSTHERAQRGIGYVPQTRDIFASLTVEENLVAGLQRRPLQGLAAAYDMFPRLAERRRNLGNQLSGGEQQMLAVARAVLGRPRLLLLDEPLEGLAPIICQELLEAFRRMADDSGVAVVMVEQQVQEALGFAREAVILEKGRQVHASSSAHLLDNPALLDRYIGMAIE
ncbi:ABC transporter ATP-binding protein [Polaromonas sp.]|uniref:ABC transporter ATP-binding protein n=1 Tax=Polaromonas sp. TaxID=1869339 RepID=UPI0035624971